jgi:hypothetical protein
VTDLENALARKSSILRELAAMDSEAPGGRPDVRSGIGGSVEHRAYRLSLYDELERLNEYITILQGPFEYDMGLRG